MKRSEVIVAIKRSDIPACVDRKWNRLVMKKENHDIDRYSERLRDIENICWGCGKPWTIRDCSWQKVKGLLHRQPGCPGCGSRSIIHIPGTHK